MLDDDDYLPISAMQHFAFCPRQAALIYIERQWEDNLLTMEGRLEHQRVDAGYKEVRRGRRQIGAVAVRSDRLRLQGVIDVLELELIDERGPDNLDVLGLRGLWQIAPVEFKHGEPKEIDCDRVQLCAQAMALEDMLGVPIESASLFYWRIRRREDVTLDEELRCKTEETAAALHRLFSSGKTPPPVYSKRCRSCSLVDLCLPKRLSGGSRYERTLFTLQEPEP